RGRRVLHPLPRRPLPGDHRVSADAGDGWPHRGDAPLRTGAGAEAARHRSPPRRRAALVSDRDPRAQRRRAARAQRLLDSSGAGADRLVQEATLSDDEQERALETRHSTAREAGRIARDAKVKRLVLTHLSSRHDVDFKPLLEQAKQEYAGPCEVAFDGLTIEV